MLGLTVAVLTRQFVKPTEPQILVVPPGNETLFTNVTLHSFKNTPLTTL